MGVAPSQQIEDDPVLRRSQRRSNRLSKSKFDQITAASQVISNVRNEIDIFAGDRSSPRYHQFQEILAAVSKEVQSVKSQSKKLDVRDQCDQFLGDIQNCLQRLETRVSFNEQTEKGLDLGSVESHSFINQGFQQPKKPTTSPPQPPPSVDTSVRQKQNGGGVAENVLITLADLERAAVNIDKSIRQTIEETSGDTDLKILTLYENKIKTLYTELEMVRSEDHTPLADRKAAIGRRLIKANNQIKRFRKNLAEKKASAQEGSINSRASKTSSTRNLSVDDFGKMEQILQDLELKALTFPGQKDERRYKDLEQVVESYWTKAYSMEAFGDEERRKKFALTERIKNILQELRKRAEENRYQAVVQFIEQEVNEFKQRVEEFSGSSRESTYLALDQGLRASWAKLSDISDEASDQVKQNKERVIEDIQKILKRLSQIAQESEENSKIKFKKEKEQNEEIEHAQLLKLTEEFQNRWNLLSFSLHVERLIAENAPTEIMASILEKIAKELFEKVEEFRKHKNQQQKTSQGQDTTDLLILTSQDYQPLQQQKQQLQQQQQQLQKLQQSQLEQQQNLLQSYQLQQSQFEQQQQQHQQVLTNIDLEIKAQPTVKIIAEIQRIGTEAKAILLQIKQTEFNKNDPIYLEIETKLKKCRLSLESIDINRKSDSIVNSKRRAQKTIAEAFRALEDIQVSAVRSSKAQEVMDIDAEIHYFRQQIKIFTGVTKDKQYDKIKSGLNECLTKLQVIDDMHIPKQESIRMIQQYHQELENKLAENQAKVRISQQSAEIKRQVSQDVKGVIEQVQKLRSQVDKFSGVYKGLQYKQIEDSLLNYLKRLEEIEDQTDEKLQSAIVQTKQKIQKYLTILEDKSIKTSVGTEEISRDSSPNRQNGYIVKETVNRQQVHSTTLESTEKFHLSSSRKSLHEDSPHNKINALREKLVELKEKTENFDGSYGDENYRDIEAKLLDYYEEIKQIDHHGHQSVVLGKQQYENYIEKLLEYFEKKVKLAEGDDESYEEKNIATSPQHVVDGTGAQAYKIPDPLEELAYVERALETLKNKIHLFKGRKNDEQYVSMDREITKLMTQLNNLETGNVVHVREKKKTIAKELYEIGLALEERVKTLRPEVLKMKDISERLNRLVEEVVIFKGVKNDKKYSELDESLIALTMELDAIDTADDANLKSERKELMRDIQKSMNILTKRAQHETITTNL